jgi:hypothetical protein
LGLQANLVGETARQGKAIMHLGRMLVLARIEVVRPRKNRSGNQAGMYHQLEEVVQTLRPILDWHRDIYHVISLRQLEEETDLQQTACLRR